MYQENSQVPSRQRLVVASVLFVTLLISYVDRVNVSVLIADPNFLKDLGIAGQPAQMGLLMTSFLLAYGVANLVLAPLGRVMGPRKAMSLAIVVWSVAVAAGGWVGSFSAMLACRVVLGIGEGLHWPMQSAFVKNWFPLGERSRANSAWLLGIMVGPLLAMPLLTSVVVTQGWRACFWVLAVCSVIPLFLVWWGTSDSPEQDARVNQLELDYIHSGQELSGDSQPAATASMAFLKDHRYWLIVLAFLSSASIFWGTIAWLPSYLKVSRGFAWAQLGHLSALPYLLGTICVVVAGVGGDLVKRKTLLSVLSLAGSSLCLYWGANVQDNLTSAYFMSGAIGFLGIGLASYWTVMQGLVETRSVGTAAGVMNGVASLGSALMPLVVGYLIGTTGDYSSGLMFLVVMGLFGACCAAALSLKRY